MGYILGLYGIMEKKRATTIVQSTIGYIIGILNPNPLEFPEACDPDPSTCPELLKNAKPYFCDPNP